MPESRQIIPIASHSHNTDKSAVLAKSSPRGSIYRTNDGYVATLALSCCLAGLFPTAGEAMDAIDSVAGVAEVA